MIRVALVGAGKMGISHLSILSAHPDVEIVGVADNSKLILDVLNKYSPFKVYDNYKTMISEVKPEAVVVSVPTKHHSSIVEELLLKNIHVFVEKPFCLNYEDSARLTDMAKQKKLINQVGYHNRFIGTFEEAKNIILNGFLGEIIHFTGEAYGPVVIKKKNNTWRSNADEGGGCLMDYASHVIDLIHFLIGPVRTVQGSILRKIFSEKVDDSINALMETENDVTGVISVNWSDQTYRKMSTTMTINGINGKIIVDSCELKVYFNNNNCPEGYSKGWNVKYITELTKQVEFYLRGEEYSLQIDHFIKSILTNSKKIMNSFSSAGQTDKVISYIKSFN